MASSSTATQGLNGVLQGLIPNNKGTACHKKANKKVPPAWLDKQSKICVVGGGAGGVHISCLLKKAGYDDITIFESAPQLGGKCMTRFSEAVPFEMGFGLNILSEGPNPLEELVKEYGLEEQRIVIGESTIDGKKRAALKMNRYDHDTADEDEDGEEETGEDGDDDDKAEDEEVQADSAENAKAMFARGKSAKKRQEDFRQSVSDLSSKIRANSFSNLPPFRRLFTRKLSDIKEQVATFFGSEPLVAAAKRYARLHRRLLGKYAYGMPPKPRPESLQQLNMSFVDLLKANNLLSLVPVFILCPVTTSYHFLCSLPAFIGLWWYNPTRVTALIDFQRGSLKVPEYTVLRSGWQGLWAKMAETNDLSVLVSTTVKSIRRGKDGSKGRLIAYTAGEDRVRTYDFDLLIIASNFKASLPLIEDATEDEKYIANALQDFTLCSTVYDAEGVVPSERPIELFPFPKRNHAFGQVFAQINSRLLVDKKGLPPSGKERRIVYQFLARSPRQEDMGMLKRRIHMYFKDQAIDKPVILKQCPWKFFPHFTSKDICDGWLWKLQEMQGANNTLFVGGSACMESVNEIILYNQSVMSSLGLH